MLSDNILDLAAAIIDAQFNQKLHYCQTVVFNVNKGHRKLLLEAVQQYHVNHGISLHRRINPAERRSQILFVHTNHWIVVSNDHSSPINEVRVYDSHAGDADCDFSHQVAAVFGFAQNSFTIQWFPVQQQADGISCGLFAIAFLLGIANGVDPTQVTLSEEVR